MAKQTWVKVDGVWREVKNVWVKIDDIWRNQVIPKGRIDGVWRDFMSYFLDVYSGTGAGAIIKREGERGNQIWRKRNSGGNATYSIAMDSNGYFYTGNNLGRLAKIDPDGERVWSDRIRSSGNCEAVAVDSDGYIYAGYDDGHVYKVTANGDVVWEIRPSPGNCKAIAVDIYGNVYTGHASRTAIAAIFKYNRYGNEVWSHRRGSNSVVSIAIGNNQTAYVMFNNGDAYKFDRTGNEVSMIPSNVGDTGSARNGNSIAVDSDGYIYLGHSNAINKLDPNENIIWQIRPEGSFIRSIAVDKNKNVYTGHSDTRLNKMDSNGESMWGRTSSFSGDEINGIVVTPLYGAFPGEW